MVNITQSNLFTKVRKVVSKPIYEPDNLESLVSPYLEEESKFNKVHRNFRYSHTHGFIFDAFKEEVISFEAVPLYYLKADTPQEVLNQIKNMQGIVAVGVEPDEDDSDRLCYSDVGTGAPILVGSKISDYYIGKKYHKRINGIEPIYRWGDFSDNNLRGVLAVIEKTRGVSITDNGASRLYEASLSSDLYYAYTLRGSNKSYNRELMFQSYELLSNLGHPSNYKVTVLKGIFLQKTEVPVTFSFSVDDNSFGEDLDKALIFATENSHHKIKITCEQGVVATVDSRNWRFIKHVIVALSKVDFNSIRNEVE